MQFRREDLPLPLIEQLHVAAQGNCRHAILGAVGVPLDPHQQRLAEPDAEAQHFESEFLCHPIVAEFVDHDQYPNGHQKSGYENHNSHAKTPALSSIKATARRLTAASTTNTSSRALTEDEPKHCN